MTTSDLRLGKNIRRVTILTKDASGQVTPTVLYEGRSAKRKQSRTLKPVESGTSSHERFSPTPLAAGTTLRPVGAGKLL